MHVKTTSTGFDQIDGVNTPATDGNSYTDVLPSATLNFIFDAEHILRLAAAKVLARPPLDELRTGRFLADPHPTVGQLTGSGANPHLEPFRAKQFDVSYEWYFHPESLLAVALFTKSVESTIGYKQGPRDDQWLRLPDHRVPSTAAAVISTAWSSPSRRRSTSGPAWRTSASIRTTRT